MTKKLTTSEYIERAKLVHGDAVSYEKTVYTNMKTKISAFCLVHLVDFEVSPVKHLCGQKCRQCAVDSWGNAKRLDTTSFINKAKKIHGDEYDYSAVNYTGSKTKVEIICRKHGSWMASPNNHISAANKNGCPKCKLVKISKAVKKTTEWFVEKAKSIHGDKYDYSDTTYNGCFTELEVKCKKHGAFTQYPYQHFSNTHACPSCSPSVSKKETEWLDYLGIAQSCRQKWIRIDGKTWSLDAIDYHTKTIYEFYGDFWHGNPESFDPGEINPHAKVTYGELYKKTMEREKIFTDAGYKITSIWERDWDSLKKSQRSILHTSNS